VKYKQTIKDLFRDNNSLQNEIHTLSQENKSLKLDLERVNKDLIDPVKFNEIKNEIIYLGNTIVEINKENKTLCKTQNQKDK